MSNELSIRLFATLKDKAGKSRISLEMNEPLEVQAFLTRLGQKYPDMDQLLAASLVAVNRQYAERTTIVNPTDEVAIFPPVSGG